MEESKYKNLIADHTLVEKIVNQYCRVLSYRMSVATCMRQKRYDTAYITDMQTELSNLRAYFKASGGKYPEIKYEEHRIKLKNLLNIYTEELKVHKKCLLDEERRLNRSTTTLINMLKFAVDHPEEWESSPSNNTGTVKYLIKKFHIK